MTSVRKRLDSSVLFLGLGPRRSPSASYRRVSSLTSLSKVQPPVPDATTPEFGGQHHRQQESVMSAILTYECSVLESLQILFLGLVGMADDAPSHFHREGRSRTNPRGLARSSVLGTFCPHRGPLPASWWWSWVLAPILPALILPEHDPPVCHTRGRDVKARSTWPESAEWAEASEFDGLVQTIAGIFCIVPIVLC